MTSRILPALALSGALLAAPAAQAISWGEHAASESYTYRLSLISNYANSFTFSLAGPSDLTASFSLSGLLGNVTVSLLDSTNAALGSFSASTASAGSASFSNLAAGNYTYAVSGSGFLSRGTLTSLATPAITTPVPEPGSLAMLLAGLGLIGLISRPRKA